MIESAAIIEYLDLHHGSAPPDGSRRPGRSHRSATDGQRLRRLLDGAVAAMAFNALRPEDKRDPHLIAEARAALDKSHAWLNRSMEVVSGRPTKPLASPTAPPPRHCSTPTGAIRSRSPSPHCAVIAAACSPEHRSNSARLPSDCPIFQYCASVAGALASQVMSVLGRGRAHFSRGRCARYRLRLVAPDVRKHDCAAVCGDCGTRIVRSQHGEH